MLRKVVIGGRVYEMCESRYYQLQRDLNTNPLMEMNTHILQSRYNAMFAGHVLVLHERTSTDGRELREKSTPTA